MEKYFLKFRKGIIGIDTKLLSPDGKKRRMIYADWVASGRNYLPIETRIQEEILPLVANTHTETSTTGMAMTHAYHTAQGIIKKHVNANSDDLIITQGSGMTGLVNKFQRMLGFKANQDLEQILPEEKCPVVFLTHMEHHSNHTSWLETIATVKIIQPTPDGLVDINSLKELIKEYKDRPLKIESVTACSNVTGISTPYYEVAQLMHKSGGYCFVDFACSAPYTKIDMHPELDNADLDVIFFSPHKFLGGPGSTGVMVFSRDLYNQKVPDNPGGGTVDWTNPWGGHKYIDDIEAREDGGTPAFLQTIKAAMCITLKNEMGVSKILAREEHLLELLWKKMIDIPNLHILASQHKDRLSVISFYIDDLHYNLGVKLLNDKFGIQVRGGCSCAGTYGHYLLNIDQSQSQQITDKINQGDLSEKPGWIRISLHPTMTDDEVKYIGESIKELAENFLLWRDEYNFDPACLDLEPKDFNPDLELKQKIDRTLTGNFLS
ncbi:MAG: aminotransferase class V-fold PLP-dependent enzyme [Anaerolineales bacterium]|nr:aminotransferase class V-fold PLP-dependent enzyme [Anaerolineales bacterium]